MNEQNKPQATITDKAFSRLVWTSIIAIFVCIACLCSGTYAWFVAGSGSSGNEIKAAQCELAVSLSDGTQTLLTADCVESKSLALSAGTYSVVMSLPAGSPSGYLAIKVDTTVYYTDFIDRHTDADPHTLTFSLVLAEDATLTFTPTWGIYSGTCNVSDGGTLTLATPSTEGEAP